MLHNPFLATLPWQPCLLVMLWVWQVVSCQGHGGPSPLLLRLNETLSGRVREAKPLAAPCFPPSSRNETSGCTTLKSQLLSGRDSLTDTYQGFQNIQGEACMADVADQCLLDSASLSPTPREKPSCRQGLVSPYYVEVTAAQDIPPALDYARRSNSSVSIKNSGHDYMMRSSRKGSLALWTRGLNKMEFHSAFVPTGCNAPNRRFRRNVKAVSAITLQSGVTMDEAMVFARAHNVLFVSGSSPSVGASGGWLLNGGHSPISGGLGLAVDRVLQFTVVTPDGQTRVANRCQHPDLFWALRGAGGGGVFGVVVDSTYLAEHERTIMSASFFWPNVTEDSKRGFVDLLARNMPHWALSGWGGPSTTSMSVLVNPFVSDIAEARDILAEAIDYVQNPTLGGAAIFQLYPTWFDFWAQVVNGSTPVDISGISSGTLLTSKVVPESVFMNDTTRLRMVDTILKLDADGFSPAFLTVAPLRYARESNMAAEETSVNPAWYRSVWHLAAYSTWDYNNSLRERRDKVAKLGAATDLLDAMVPLGDGCTYSNEADIWLKDWEWEYWGDNYPRLMAIKRRYDPDGVMDCWHCVGWDPSLPDYQCISGVL